MAISNPDIYSRDPCSQDASNYENWKLLGNGASAQVYYAERRSDGEPVALKKVPIYQQDEKRFREPQILSSIKSHPDRLSNVVYLETSYFEKNPEIPDADFLAFTKDLKLGFTLNTGGSENHGSLEVVRETSFNGVQDSEEIEPTRQRFESREHGRCLPNYVEVSPVESVTQEPREAEPLEDAEQNEIDERQARNMKNLMAQARMGFLYMLFPVYEGDLYQLMKKSAKKAANDSVKITKQVLLALEFIHKIQIVHRDVKPENIFLKSKADVQVVLGDFGLARCLKDRNGDGDSDELKLTAEIGTPKYRAPELTQGSRYDYKVDVYSLGVLVDELFKGHSTCVKTVKMVVIANKYMRVEKPENRKTAAELLELPILKKETL